MKRFKYNDSLAANNVRKYALVEDLKSKIDREKLKTEG